MIDVERLKTCNSIELENAIAEHIANHSQWSPQVAEFLIAATGNPNISFNAVRDVVEYVDDLSDRRRPIASRKKGLLYTSEIAAKLVRNEGFRISVQIGEYADKIDWMKSRFSFFLHIIRDRACPDVLFDALLWAKGNISAWDEVCGEFTGDPDEWNRRVVDSFYRHNERLE